MKSLFNSILSFLFSLFSLGKVFSQGYNIRDYPQVDSFTLNNGITLYRGDSLRLGKGTCKDGDFWFVETNKYLSYSVSDFAFDVVVEGLLNPRHKTRNRPLDAKYAGQSLEIVRIEQRRYYPGTFKKYVHVYYAILRLGKDWLIQAELENSYKSGEITFDEASILKRYNHE